MQKPTLSAITQHQRDRSVHMSHCDQGEWKDTCKYGESDCPKIQVATKNYKYVVEASVDGQQRTWKCTDWYQLYKTLYSLSENFEQKSIKDIEINANSF